MLCVQRYECALSFASFSLVSTLIVRDAGLGWGIETPLWTGEWQLRAESSCFYTQVANINDIIF
jgi:hypothetical protein